MIDLLYHFALSRNTKIHLSRENISLILSVYVAKVMNVLSYN